MVVQCRFAAALEIRPSMEWDNFESGGCGLFPELLGFFETSVLRDWNHSGGNYCKHRFQAEMVAPLESEDAAMPLQKLFGLGFSGQKTEKLGLEKMSKVVELIRWVGCVDLCRFVRTKLRFWAFFFTVEFVRRLGLHLFQVKLTGSCSLGFEW